MIALSGPAPSSALSRLLSSQRRLNVERVHGSIPCSPQRVCLCVFFFLEHSVALLLFLPLEACGALQPASATPQHPLRRQIIRSIYIFFPTSGDARESTAEGSLGSCLVRPSLSHPPLPGRGVLSTLLPFFLAHATPPPHPCPPHSRARSVVVSMSSLGLDGPACKSQMSPFFAHSSRCTESALIPRQSPVLLLCRAPRAKSVLMNAPMCAAALYRARRRRRASPRGLDHPPPSSRPREPSTSRRHRRLGALSQRPSSFASVGEAAHGAASRRSRMALR